MNFNDAAMLAGLAIVNIVVWCAVWCLERNQK